MSTHDATKSIYSVRRQIEMLISEHYNDVEIQNILKERAIVTGIGFIRKVRDDVTYPSMWMEDRHDRRR